jgi:hypothetical protein
MTDQPTDGSELMMARRRDPWRRLARDAHMVSRAAGDISAAQRGMPVLAKRLVRRALTRALFRALTGR